MLYMSDDEARAAGLYLVIDADGVPTSESPLETVERAGRLVDEQAAMIRQGVRDGLPWKRLLEVRETLGELHVDMDMLSEELSGWEFEAVSIAGTVVAVDESTKVERPAETAETAAKLADELAATVNTVMVAGFNRYRLNDVIVGLGAMADDFADLAATLRMHAAGDRGAA